MIRIDCVTLCNGTTRPVGEGVYRRGLGRSQDERRARKQSIATIVITVSLFEAYWICILSMKSIHFWRELSPFSLNPSISKFIYLN